MSPSKYNDLVKKPLNKRLSACLGLFGTHIPLNKKRLLIKYYLKRLFRRQHSKDEHDIYFLYSFLIDSGAYFSSEHSNEFKIRKKNQSITISTYLRKLPSSDQLVYSQVFIYKQYLPVVNMLLKSYSKETAITIIDAGANIGLSTLYFKSFFPNAKIVAIEPEESNFQQLLKNIESNSFADVCAVQQALWHREAYLSVTNANNAREWAFSVEESTQATSLKGHELSHFINLLQNSDTQICLLKIDIEGAERYLFDTVENGTELLNKCEYLAIEIHDQGELRKRIYKSLEAAGFVYTDADELTIAQKIIK